MPGANVIDPAGTQENIRSHIFSSATGIALSAFNYTGSFDAAGVYDSINLSPTFNLERGVLLSTGYGNPNRTNTGTSIGIGRGQLGNSDLDAFASAAFNGAGTTQDASIVTLTFHVDNPGVKSIKFDLAFGSDEYPEYSDSSFVDIAAVWTGTGNTAKNYALINGKKNQPLSVTEKNVKLGNFIDNSKGGYAIEYDGLIKKQTVYVPVHQGDNVINIGIADTGDAYYDSGVFISGIEGSSAEAGGTLQQFDVNKDGKFDAKDVNALFEGLPEDFQNVIINHFGPLDKILLNDTLITELQSFLGIGSMVLKFDTDNDGKVDTKIELKNPINGRLHLSSGADGTTVTIDKLKQATKHDDKIGGTKHLDYLAGGKGDDKLNGKGGSDALVGGAGNDKLNGGKGADSIAGGTGADDMFAGKDKATDVFIFAKGDSGTDAKDEDHIFQFHAGGKNGDMINLHALHVKFGDVDLHVKHGDTTVAVNYKDDGKADMVFVVDAHLHKGDFLL